MDTVNNDNTALSGKGNKETQTDQFNLNGENYLDLFRIGNKTVLDFYDYDDFDSIANLTTNSTHSTRLYDLDKLLERDKLREMDGFPRKIKLGKLIKPSKDGKGRTIIIPTSSEEKLYHWLGKEEVSEGASTGGTGDEQDGEVIGEEPLRPEGEGEGQGAGQGQGAEHGMGADAYDIGRILTEQFELPNIQPKGKKTSLTKFTYELTDKNRGHGQIIDKKATIKRIIKTNLALGRISAKKKADTSKLLITPGDKVYRILSREKDYEAQAVVFFVRDYSGSMHGKPTEVVVTQHVYINSWLIYQYHRQVKSRFILHDNEAVEVPDFYTYYNKNVAGGTDVSAGYALVNKIVEDENLAKDYNIYVFHGTDGDDWERDGKRPLQELEQMIHYSNRIGITIAENSYSGQGNTIVENYIKESNLLEKHEDKLHLDSFRAADADETRIIEGIKNLIVQ